MSEISSFQAKKAHIHGVFEDVKTAVNDDENTDMTKSEAVAYACREWLQGQEE